MHEHEKTVQRLKGIAAAFGALLTIAHFAIDFLIGKTLIVSIPADQEI